MNFQWVSDSISFLCLLFLFLIYSKNSPLDYSGAKKEVLPRLNYWGDTCPGCPPESTPMVLCLFYLQHWDRNLIRKTSSETTLVTLVWLQRREESLSSEEHLAKRIEMVNAFGDAEMCIMSFRTALIIGVDFGGNPGTSLPIIEKCPCFHQLSPPFPPYFHGFYGSDMSLCNHWPFALEPTPSFYAIHFINWWAKCLFSFSQDCSLALEALLIGLQEVLYKCIDTTQYNTIQYFGLPYQYFWQVYASVLDVNNVDPKNKKVNKRVNKRLIQNVDFKYAKLFNRWKNARVKLLS